MTNTELNKALRALAEEFAEGVIRAITALPLNKLALTMGREPRAPAPPAPVARGPNASTKKSAPARGPRKGASKGRSIREEVLAILQRSKDWMTSEQIKPLLSRVPSRNAVFVALQRLHDNDLIVKRGSKRSMAYQVTRKGLEARG